ncbi:hypothetical protein [Fusobacterium sp.]|uniref:hypothetical protein n=1 Tax=Fusobacterium sp. TaxID=68766 RepID=UPI00396C5B37
MKIFNFIKQDKINFFTLEEAVKFQEKKGVLVLDSSFFILLKISLSTCTDPREREFEIEDEICEYIEEYNPFDYIEKEITLSQTEEEVILVVLIEREKVEKIIESLREYKITLSGIFPLFFMEFFNKESEAKTYIEIEENRFRLYFFKNEKLYDFSEVEFSAEELIEDPSYIEDYLENSNYVFTYDNKENKKYSSIYFINFRNWKDYHLYYKEEYNFLPDEYIEGFKLKKTIKILICILAISIIIESCISLLLNIYIKNSMKKINLIHSDLNQIKNKISNEKEMILELEKDIAMVEKENSAHSFSDIKISRIIDKIFNAGVGIEIFKIDFNGKNKITVAGKTDFEENFYNFQRKILQYKDFIKVNHDFFNFKDNFYEFKLEIEVSNDIH